MAEEMKGTNISSPLVPFTKDDKYATHDETFGRGGYRSVSSIAEMNAIPAERRKEGMLVNVLNDRIYQLKNNSFVDAGLGSGGGGGTPAPSGTGHNLNIDIRIRRTDSSAQYPHQQYLQYRINEIVENGYICFLRKKRCSNSKMKQITNKYTIPYFSFNHAGNGPVGPTRAYDERTIIPVDSHVKVGEWNTFPDNIDMFINKTTDAIYFTGDVHANPNKFSGGGVNKHISVLKIALQYCIINPNYVNSIKENDKIPMSILESGNLAKLKVRLMNVKDSDIASGYKVIFSVD